jgi:hypothetical protein
LLLAGAGRPALAGSCEVSPDQKSLTLRTDNPAATEKTCGVICEVEAVDGSFGTVACSGVLVPAGAKGFELCAETRDEPFYAKPKVTESGCG